jgi:hypothetical protein
MKKLFFYVFLASLVVVGCKSNEHVQNDSFIQKRKFTKGYYVKSRKATHNKPLGIASNKRAKSHSRRIELENQLIAALEENRSIKTAEDSRSNAKKRSSIEQSKSDVKETIGLKTILKASKKETDRKMARINRKVATLLGQQTSDNQENTDVIQQVEGLGLAGMIASIIGLFVAGIVLGSLAIVFGFISLSKIEKHPDRFKGRGFAIASIILGVIALVGALVFLSMA